MGHQTTLLTRNKLDPNSRYDVDGLTIRFVGPITPEPNRVHGLRLQRRIAGDNVYRIDGSGVTHHYLEYDDLGPLSLRQRRKAWAHHREAR